MAGIEWYWFIITGVSVTVISAFSSKLSIFIAIGGLMIIVGLGKFAVAMNSKKRGSRAGRSDIDPFRHTDQQKRAHESAHLNTNHARPVPHYKICPGCGAQLRIQDNFCSSCGARMPHPNNMPQRRPMHSQHPGGQSVHQPHYR